jgi:hypothetical protein
MHPVCRAVLILSAVLSFPCLQGNGQEPPLRSKYGPNAIRLYDARGHIQQTPAPDYWALMPYYQAQPNESACSLAAVCMLMNGLRVREKLHANEPLVTPTNLLEKLNHAPWSAAVAKEGYGVSLDELADIVRSSLSTYGLKNYRVEAIHIEKASAAELSGLRKRLADNEESDQDFLIANFLQSSLTGDPEGSVGHFAPVAAYDARLGRVLILDPDRQWYEPYWVSDQTLLAGMATKDPQAKRARGYLWIHPRTD